MNRLEELKNLKKNFEAITTSDIFKFLIDMHIEELEDRAAPVTEIDFTGLSKTIKIPPINYTGLKDYKRVNGENKLEAMLNAPIITSASPGSDIKDIRIIGLNENFEIIEEIIPSEIMRLFRVEPVENNTIEDEIDPFEDDETRIQDRIKFILCGGDEATEKEAEYINEISSLFKEFETIEAMHESEMIDLKQEYDELKLDFVSLSKQFKGVFNHDLKIKDELKKAEKLFIKSTYDNDIFKKEIDRLNTVICKRDLEIKDLNKECFKMECTIGDIDDNLMVKVNEELVKDVQVLENKNDELQNKYDVLLVKLEQQNRIWKD